MRTGNLEIIAGPCQYLPTMSYEQRSIAWTFFRQTDILPGRMVRLLHTHFTLESFIELFCQKINDSGFRQLKKPVLFDSLEPVSTPIFQRSRFHCLNMVRIKMLTVLTKRFRHSIFNLDLGKTYTLHIDSSCKSNQGFERYRADTKA